jgi:hypothetical protein
MAAPMARRAQTLIRPLRWLLVHRWCAAFTLSDVLAGRADCRRRIDRVRVSRGVDDDLEAGVDVGSSSHRRAMG